MRFLTTLLEARQVKLLSFKFFHSWKLLVFVFAGLLSGCGAGDGTGLDQNGQPIAGGGSCTDPAPATGTLCSIQAKVFTPSCAFGGCHGQAPQQGLQLDSVANSAATLINIVSPQDPTLVRVRPGLSGTSFLIQKLRGTQTVGSQMPLGAPALSPEAIAEIAKWIDDGANP